MSQTCPNFTPAAKGTSVWERFQKRIGEAQQSGKEEIKGTTFVPYGGSMDGLEAEYVVKLDQVAGGIVEVRTRIRNCPFFGDEDESFALSVNDERVTSSTLLHSSTQDPVDFQRRILQIITCVAECANKI